MAQRHILAGLIKWMDREPWHDRFLETMAEHTEEACEEAGIAVPDIAEVLGQTEAMTVWGAVFEDFLTRPYDDEGGTIVDDYLKRRGCKETLPTRRYMEAVRDSVMSVYEVSGIVPGESFLARDLIRGGDCIRVSERSATKMLKPWDRIATRIVEVNGKTMMTGGTLVLGPDAADDLIEYFSSAPGVLRQTIHEVADGDNRDLLDGLDLDAAINDSVVLGMSSEAFTAAWLGESLHRALHPPQVVNHDGDPIEFQTVRYPLVAGAADVARQRLGAHPDLREEGETFWNWIAPPGSPLLGQGSTQTFTTTLSDGAPVLGNIEVKDDAVLLHVNSQARVERGQTLLGALLGELAGAPSVAATAADSAKAKNAAAKGDVFSEPERIDAVWAYLDQHYHSVLDQPLARLDNETPRAAAQTPHGRAKLAAWLKYLENQTAANPDRALQYNFGWMWTELGVAELRA